LNSFLRIREKKLLVIEIPYHGYPANLHMKVIVLLRKFQRSLQE
jgi:hypothetical protein